VIGLFGRRRPVAPSPAAVIHRPPPQDPCRLRVDTVTAGICDYCGVDLSDPGHP